jgi:hypothetical protein
MALSKTSVNRRLVELRQDQDNMIQSNYRPIWRKPKETTKAYKIANRLVTYIPEYQRAWGAKPSVRTVFYGLQDEHIITRGDKSLYSDVTVQARLGWVDTDGNLIYPKIPIDAFSDAEDHSKTVGDFKNHPPLDPEPPPNPHQYIQYLIEQVQDAEQELETARQTAMENLLYAKQQLLEGPNNYEGIGTKGRRGGRWYGQSEYVEVWEEKVDLAENFDNLLSVKGVKTRGNGGYPSLLFLNLCCIDLKDVMEKFQLEPEHIHIKYCGDWDPSGIGIDYYIQKRCKQLGIDGIDFQRIAVTDKQIDDYHLPLMDIKKDPNKKTPNPNLAEFRRLYGDKATHLNALMTLKHKNDFKKILYKAVDEHWNQEIYDDMIKQYEGPPEIIEDIDGTRETMRREAKDAGYSLDDE